MQIGCLEKQLPLRHRLLELRTGCGYWRLQGPLLAVVCRQRCCCEDQRQQNEVTTDTLAADTLSTATNCFDHVSSIATNDPAQQLDQSLIRTVDRFVPKSSIVRSEPTSSTTLIEKRMREL